MREVPIIEIDTRFWNALTGEQLLGLGVIWIDTGSASHNKWSVFNPEISAYYEAHVEGVEKGVHTILIDNGPGYTINHIHLPKGKQIDGPGAVNVEVDFS